MRGLLLLLFFSQAGWSTPDLSKAIQIDVEKYELSNGLTVLLAEDHSVPMVSYHQWFRVGSKDEDAGRTGLAHFFEHMMFKGTPKHSKEFFGQELASKGAEFNAFTSDDYTGYYIEIPKDHLKLAIDIESDRMRNLTLDPKDVNSEREVVKEERRMRYDNQPEGVIRESLDEMMFKNLPYRWPVIGSMEDLNQASNADLRAFYKRYYSPNNAVVVVAGDFSKDDSQSLDQAVLRRYSVRANQSQIISGRVGSAEVAAENCREERASADYFERLSCAAGVEQRHLRARSHRGHSRPR